MTRAQLDELDACVSRMQQIAHSAKDETVSTAMLEFGIGDHWDEWVERINELFQRLTKSVAHFAWVEHCGALSVVSWTGDLNTVWSGAGTSDDRAAHWSALSAALRFRAKLILAIAAAVQTTATIAAASASPLTAIAALRSARMLVMELRELEALANNRSVSG
jgi:hypothetical protein